MTEAPKIMYVCEDCADNNPEGCGHYDRDLIRKTPNGHWLCETCYDDMRPEEVAQEPDAEGEWPDKPDWKSLPTAPAITFSRSP